MSPFLPQKKEKGQLGENQKMGLKGTSRNSAQTLQLVIPAAGNSHILQAFHYHTNKSVFGLCLHRRDDNTLEMSFSEIKHAIAAGVHLSVLQRTNNERAASSMDGSQMAFNRKILSGHE